MKRCLLMDRKTKKSAEQKKLVARNTIISVLVIVFLVSIISIYHHNLYKEKRESIIRKGEATAKESADEFDKYLSTNIDSIKLAAYALDEMITDNRSNDEIQDYLVAQSTAIKSAVLENSTGLYGYINGRFFSGTNWVPPADYDPVARPWYTKPFEKPGEITILDPYVDVQSGNTMLALGKTLCDDESVISVDVSLDQIQLLTEQAVAEKNCDIEMILNDQGVVVAHSDKNEVGKDYPAEENTLGKEIVSHLTEDADYFEFSFDGSRYFAYVADIQHGWFCISIKDATSTFASLNRMLILTVSVEIIIVLIISILMSRSTRLRIQSIRTQAESEAKTAFLSNVSHEIRTPINTVLGMNEMILRESSERTVLAHAEKVKSAGVVLLEIVNNMLDHARFEEGWANAGAAEFAAEFRNEIEHAKTINTSGKYRATFTAPDVSLLAVDDNPMNLIVFKGLVKETGMMVDAVGSGEEALKYSAEKTYDILFLDHMMPEKDGIETLHDIRSDETNPNHKTVAVCLTANAIAGAREQYLAAGFDEYLSKPVDPEKLEEMILNLLPQDKVIMRQEDELNALEQEEQKNADIPAQLLALDGKWLYVDTGIKNSGSAELFLSLLKVFYESVDENAEAICKFYEDKDYKNYTIRVHALKSSARIVGATDFGEEAQQLENAGKAEDIGYIRAHHADFIEGYRRYKELLDGLFDTVESDADKPEADAGLMEEVYAELADAAADMDCDRLEDAFAEMAEYRIPKEEEELFSKLKAASDRFEYKTVLALLSERNAE